MKIRKTVPVLFLIYLFLLILGLTAACAKSDLEFASDSLRFSMENSAGEDSDMFRENEIDNNNKIPTAKIQWHHSSDLK